MKTALIGYSGFVGQTLMKQTTFNDFYRSTNISEIENKSYDLIVCAGAPAKKWSANNNPLRDAATIDSLIDHLRHVQAKTFVLISTVDVFKSPCGINELSPITTEGLHAYGYNRWCLEEFVRNHFERHLIIRLPGLVGPGLKKNIIFDFLNDNQINLIESRNIFQFYPMTHLWDDIQVALQKGYETLHLTAEPVSVEEIVRVALGQTFTNHLEKPLIHYDMQSIHAQETWGNGNYQYTKDQSLMAIKNYFKTEPKQVAGVSA